VFHSALVFLIGQPSRLRLLPDSPQFLFSLLPSFGSCLLFLIPVYLLCDAPRIGFFSGPLLLFCLPPSFGIRLPLFLLFQIPAGLLRDALRFFSGSTVLPGPRLLQAFDDILAELLDFLCDFGFCKAAMPKPLPVYMLPPSDNAE
jgi:hypothetical protein